MLWPLCWAHHLARALWAIGLVLPIALLSPTYGQEFVDTALDDTITYTFSAAALLGQQNVDSALVPFQTYSSPSRPSTLTPPFTIRGIAERNLGVGGSSTNPRGGMTDLTIEGPLYHGIHTTIRIADQSLPFQPQGTSQDLRLLNEFYIHLYDSSWRLEAGEILLHTTQPHFLQATQQAQGLLGSVSLRTRHNDHFRLKGAYGLPKGEVKRVILTPFEGVQGPYELQGNRAFTRVVVLAKSEKVYLDGQLLTRGLDQDYIIDYNLGAITFTARCPITARSRLVVEYETSSTPYRQHGGQLSLHGDLRHGWHFSLEGFMTFESKRTDANERNNPSQSAFPDPFLSLSTEHSQTQQVYYKLSDTTVEGQRYQIYVATGTRPVSNAQIVPFGYVGPNLGNYIIKQEGNNAQYFQWIAPQQGIPQGSYEPSLEQRAPKRHLVVESTIGKRWRDSAIGLAVTGAYSLQGSRENERGEGFQHGGALQVDHYALLRAHERSTLRLQAQGRWVHRTFTPFQPFIPTELAHQWGIHDSLLERNFADVSLALLGENPQGQWRMVLKGLMRPALLGGAVNIGQQHRWANWTLNNSLQVSLVERDITRYHQGQAASDIAYHWHHMTLGSTAKGEWKRQFHAPTRLLPADFGTLLAGPYLSLNDTTRYSTRLALLYEQKWDTLQAQLLPSSKALIGKLEGQVELFGTGAISASLGYKHFLSVAQAWRNQANDHFLGDLALRLPLWESRVALLLNAQLQGEAIQQWQMHYIPVPVGEGQYVWLDVNQDGVAQLNEFALAQHRDQACYALQYVPSSQRQLATAGRNQLVIQISPRAQQAPIDSSTQWWLRWDIHLALANSSKRIDNRWYLAPIPWLAQDSSRCPESNSSFQAQLQLNHNAWPLELSYSFALMQSHQLLAQGIQAHKRRAHTVALSSPTLHGWRAQLSLLLANEQCLQPYRSRQTVKIRSLEVSAALSYETASQVVQTFSPQFQQLSQESPKTQRIQSYNYRLECPLGHRWQANMSLTYAYVASEKQTTDALSYELLRGLGKGHNGLLEAQLRYKITRYLEGSVTYAFRKSQHSAAVHSGYLQLQASF